MRVDIAGILRLLKVKRVIRVGVSIPLLIALTSFSIQICYGLTVNDLRSSLGQTHKNNTPALKNEYIIEVKKGDSISENEEASSDTWQGEHISSEIENLRSVLKQSLEDNASAYVINGIANNIKTLLEMDTDKNTQTGSGLSGNLIGTILPKEVEPEKNVLDSDYSIGNIGSNAVSITSNYRKLVTPWGYEQKSDGTIGDKLEGVRFGVKSGDSINAQWNGVVSSIEKDSLTGGSKITIYHGDGLYTTYSHVQSKSDLAEGMSITQGEKIGEALDTTKALPELDNHVEYQIKLDGEYINPLLVYGNSGQSIYEDWYKSSESVNLIEEGEEYFTQEPDYQDISLYIKGDTQKVIYTDFNMTED